MDERLEHLRPNHRVEHQHLVDWRPLEFDLYSLLRSQPVVLMDDNAPAARSDGRSAGRADEDDAMDDVPHAIDVLLHVQ